MCLQMASAEKKIWPGRTGDESTVEQGEKVDIYISEARRGVGGACVLKVPLF